MIIAAKIVVRKSFVGVDVAECQSATVLDVACDGGRHHFVVSYADPTENGTVRPKPRWLLRGSEFPISVTDKVGGRSLRKAKRRKVRIGQGRFRGRLKVRTVQCQVRKRPRPAIGIVAAA